MNISIFSKKSLFILFLLAQGMIFQNFSQSPRLNDTQVALYLDHFKTKLDSWHTNNNPTLTSAILQDYTLLRKGYYNRVLQSLSVLQLITLLTLLDASYPQDINDLLKRLMILLKENTTYLHLQKLSLAELLMIEQLIKTLKPDYNENEDDMLQAIIQDRKGALPQTSSAGVIPLTESTPPHSLPMRKNRQSAQRLIRTTSHSARIEHPKRLFPSSKKFSFSSGPQINNSFLKIPASKKGLQGVKDLESKTSYP